MRAEFERYEEYEDSGVESLGELPINWKIFRLKDLADIKNSNVDKKSNKNETSIQLCNYVDVYKNEFISASLDFMWATANESEIKRFKLYKNDVIITKDSETCDDIAIPALVTESLNGVICGYHLAQIRTDCNVLLGSYLFRLFQSKIYGFRFIVSAKGITRVGLSRSSIQDSLTPVPSLNEQTAIANYLDQKTAQIDQKIDLLNQKAVLYGQLKQSLINETVTRGLDKSAPMKDSGVEWIGEVPAHWQVKRFKDIFNKTHTGWTPDTNNVDSFIGSNIWVTIKDMNNELICDSINKLSDKAINEAGIRKTPKGSLLFSFKLTIGKIAFAGCDLFTNEAIISIEDETKVNLQYYFYTLPIFLVLNAKENIYGAKMLNQSLILNTLLLCPPNSEQVNIAIYLKQKTTQIDQIIITIQTQIENLKELRKTLINDVVTGKIKVAHQGPNP